ncbi:DNA-binding transcriptional regulator, LysR family [Clostridium cavendishii DSM 21758]|uniref:DNA-binding transcriptional regulator, LysR family n=1 Tax=Clostridium cavendishii DSM 21758 TaxID=1121302 RepID=A0A1M6R4W2_9CLOT|nr:LysR family transcriptional regulator [Clostridium cavendishii]SHK27515.1 DNA-binding transcriptional regulator, LysR family [Clostridium cavendishii DSM 21758]
MELRNVKTFIKVAEMNSFSKAGESLGYAQSTVTLQMKQLEEELGVPLFERKGKRISLSQKGHEFLTYANKLVKYEAEAIQSISHMNEPSGELHIGILESLSVSEYINIIKEYMETYPDVSLIVKIATTLELMKMLEKGLLDIIILLDQKVFNSNWEVPFEKEERILFFCSPKHPMSNEHVYLSDLAKEKFILTEKGCNYRQVFEEFLAAQRLTANCLLDIGSTNTIIDYVKNGLGISLLPEFNLKENLKNHTINEILVTDCNILLYTQVIFNKNRWMSPAMKVFLSTISNYFDTLNYA